MQFSNPLRVTSLPKGPEEGTSNFIFLPRCCTRAGTCQTILLLRIFFQSHFLKSPHEIELGAMICSSFNACQWNHLVFSRHWRTNSYFLFHLTNITFLTRVSWMPALAMVVIFQSSPLDSIYPDTCNSGMCFAGHYSHQSAFKGDGRQEAFEPLEQWLQYVPVGKSMLPCGNLCCLCWVNGWLSRNTA